MRYIIYLSAVKSFNIKIIAGSYREKIKNIPFKAYIAEKRALQRSKQTKTLSSANVKNIKL